MTVEKENDVYQVLRCCRNVKYRERQVQLCLMQGVTWQVGIGYVAPRQTQTFLARQYKGSTGGY